MAQPFMQDPLFHWDISEITRRGAKMLKTLQIVGGIVATILGLCLLFWPGKSILVLTIILGIYFTCVGVIRIISAFTLSGVPGGWRVLEALTGVFMLIAAAIIFKNTGGSASFLLLFSAIMIGVSWIFEGILSLTEAAGAFHSGWSIFAGIISILAGIIVIFSPISSAIMLITFAAIAMVIFGIVALVRGITFPKVQ
jgi:uncharacterized membrane protein HdeD (DUF308 family)